MMLTECLPQLNLVQASNTMSQTVIDDEDGKVESMPINMNSNSLATIKIPLVSFQPILATSSNYILANECTKRRNQFVLFDDHFEKFTMRSFIKEPMLDALWYDKEKHFLILTSTNVYTLDPISMEINLLNDLIPKENQMFQCFTLLNQSKLLIAYNQWNPEYDQWQEDENGQWRLMQRQFLKLSLNEFIGNMIASNENDCTYLAITIYNHLTEQWRMEMRYAETLICHKSILLPGSNMTHDYKIISIKNAQANIKWLVFSSGNSNIIAIDDQWKKIPLTYRNPTQRMALFNENYLILRTTERVDIHLFI